MSKVESESECSSKDGIYIPYVKKDGGKCYTYLILKRICLMVAFKVHPKTSSYSWEYRGGCYGTGEIGVYEKATLGSEYRFDQIPIEVREDESLYVLAGNISSDVRNSSSPILMFLSTLFMILAFLCAIGFAILYIRQLKNVDSAAMAHREQVDAE